MIWSHIGFVARRVRQSLWEMLWNHVLTSGTMATSLFVFGFFILVQENIHHMLKGWGDQIQINTYLDKEIGSDQVQAILERIRALPEVNEARHISREQAWRDFPARMSPI